ncbi:MAG: methyltransferase [Kineosporiaceae bacterium]|nr:methyltransferase [Kineosporiaceae bacterium]
MSAPTSVPIADPAGISALRADLDSAGYTVDGARDLLGPLAAAALDREQSLPARRVVAQRAREALGDTDSARLRLARLIGLFTLGVPLDGPALDAALPRLGAVGAVRLGLVRPTRGAAQFVAAVDLRPYGDETHAWWLASDCSELATGAPVAPDHVLGIGGASATLASWTPRRPVSRALDLGTGCGVQALHLATHAASVTATDLSNRAVAFAGFNAALNRQDWRLLTGSMLEPVAGQRFDLVVSNPPFVITPRTADLVQYTYRDGGRVGDGIVAELIGAAGSGVSGVADVLQPGGVAQFLANWEVGAGADWRDRVRAWVEPTGLDAWVVQRELTDPAQYAELWARDGGHVAGSAESGAAFEAMYAAWLDDFEAREVAAIGFGVITLQRPERARPAFVDLVEVLGPVAPVMGTVVDAGLAARTWLAEHDDADLLARHWQVAPDVTQEHHYRPGEADPAVILVRQGGGLGLAHRVDTVAAAYVSVADGELSADQAAVAIAALLDADTEAVRAQVAGTVRTLVRDGLLTIGDAAAS